MSSTLWLTSLSLFTDNSWHILQETWTHTSHCGTLKAPEVHPIYPHWPFQWLFTDGKARKLRPKTYSKANLTVAVRMLIYKPDACKLLTNCMAREWLGLFFASVWSTPQIRTACNSVALFIMTVCRARDHQCVFLLTEVADRPFLKFTPCVVWNFLEELSYKTSAEHQFDMEPLIPIAWLISQHRGAQEKPTPL